MANLSNTYVYNFNAVAETIRSVLDVDNVDWHWTGSGKIGFTITPNGSSTLPHSIEFWLGASFDFFTPDELVQYAVKTYRASLVEDERGKLAVWGIQV